MKLRETAIGGMSIVVALSLSVCLVAASAHASGAYFTDAKAGIMTGTYAAPEPPASAAPFRLEAGTSKALHWSPGDSCDECDHGDNGNHGSNSGHSGSGNHGKNHAPASGARIARSDANGAMYLDFGEAPAGHGDSRSDVFRIVSLVSDTRAVTFSMTGPLADFVTVVRLRNGRSGVLRPGRTERVYFKIRVPEHAAARAYTGTLSVHVQGWATDAEIPMTFDVCDKKSKDSSHEIPLGVTPGEKESTMAPPSMETTITVPPVPGEPEPSPTAPTGSSEPSTTPIVPVTPPIEATPSVPPTSSALPETSTPAPTETATCGVTGG